MGQTLETQHRAATEEFSIPLIGFDYFCITSGEVKLRNELEIEKVILDGAALEMQRKKGTLAKCRIMRCAMTKIVFAHSVPYKGQGDDQYVASLVVSNIDCLGHTRMILKADNKLFLFEQ